MKCWVVFSLAALLDLALPAKFHGKISDMVKISFLVWCLVPLNINGSDLLFDFVVAPVHWVITRALEVCLPPTQYLGVLVSGYVIQPALETGHQLVTLLTNNIKLVVSLTPGQSVTEGMLNCFHIGNYQFY